MENLNLQLNFNSESDNSRSRHKPKSRYTQLNMSLVLFVLFLSSCAPVLFGSYIVYIRFNSFGQLLASSTLRWVKGHVKDAVVLVKPDQVICRVSHAGKKIYGYFMSPRIKKVTQGLSYCFKHE